MGVDASGVPFDSAATGLVRDRVHRRRGSGGRRRSVSLRYDEAEYALVAAAAARAGLSVTGYVAAAGVAAAGQVEPPGSVAVRDAVAELVAARGQVRHTGVNLNQAVAVLHATGTVPAGLRAAAAALGRTVDGRRW